MMTEAGVLVRHLRNGGQRTAGEKIRRDVMNPGCEVKALWTQKGTGAGDNGPSYSGLCLERQETKEDQWQQDR
jgi:hypothetical protein